MPSNQDDELKNIYGKIFDETNLDVQNEEEKVSENHLAELSDSKNEVQNRDLQSNKKSKEKFKNFFQKLKEGIFVAFKKTIQCLKKACEVTKKALIKAWKKTKSWSIKAWNKTKQFFKNTFQKETFSKAYQTVKKGLVIAYKASIKAVVTAYKAVSKAIVIAFHATVKAIVIAYHAVVKALVKAFYATKKALIIAFVETKKFVKLNYIYLEMVVFGLALFGFAFLPVIQIFAVNFFDVFERYINLYEIAGWMFAGQVQTGISLSLSLFSFLYFVLATTSITLGILLSCNVIKNHKLIFNYVAHVSVFFVLILFTLGYIGWTTSGELINLSQIGVNTLFYNYNTVSFSTYVYFIITFVIVVFSVMYLSTSKKKN